MSYAQNFFGFTKRKNISIVNAIEENGEIMEGELLIEDRKYPIFNGVPIFYSDGMEENSKEQELANQRFSFKWGKALTEYDDKSFNVLLNFVLKRFMPLEINNQKDYNDFLKTKK